MAMKPMGLFGLFGLAATGAGILTGSLLLFQKAMGRAALASNVTLTIVTITLLLAGAQILGVGIASEIVSRTCDESRKKPVYVSRPATASGNDLGIREEVADRVHGDGGNHFEIHANPPQTPAQPRRERPVLMVSAHQPRLVRTISRNDSA
jgi:hypothetical protein